MFSKSLIPAAILIVLSLILTVLSFLFLIFLKAASLQHSAPKHGCSTDALHVPSQAQQYCLQAITSNTPQNKVPTIATEKKKSFFQSTSYLLSSPTIMKPAQSKYFMMKTERPAQKTRMT